MNEEKVRCPYCRELIYKDAVKCKHCGSLLSDLPFSAVDSDTRIRNALASRFEIQEELGRGGMSIVYKAIQKNLNRPVALKVLPGQFTHDKEFLERFHREAQSAAQLKHPSIVTIYDEGSESGVHFISMEYVDGKDLHTLIQEQGPLPVNKTKALISSVAKGLGHAHEMELIHRDIKSSNILIDKKGRPVLSDFGIARAADSQGLTQTGIVIGTPEYMSPEQARGEKLDARSDIYSLGVVLYECLTRQVPFKSDTILGTIHKITHDKPERPRALNNDIPIGLENVVLRCIEKDTEQRYSSCEVMVNALEGRQRHKVYSPQVSESNKDSSSPMKQVKIRQLIHEREKRESTPAWLKIAIILVSALLLVVIVLVVNQRKPTSIGSTTNSSHFEDANGSTTAVSQNENSRMDQRGEANSVIGWLSKARTYLASNQLTTPIGANAMDMIDKVLNVNSSHPEALRLKQDIANKYEVLGDSQANRKRYDTALHYYKKSLDINKNNISVIDKIDKMSMKLSSSLETTDRKSTSSWVESNDVILRDVEQKKPADLGLQSEPPSPTPPPPEESEAIVFIPYDKPPVPKGGFVAIQRNLIYPRIAFKAGVEGKVLVYAQIDEEGKVVQTRLMQSLVGCDDAAVNAIKSVSWEPAMQRNKPVKVWVMVPVSFRIK
ncbi:hypothetical protein BVY01_02740 [bacterium I07]|nr:hypothetical protein BVY01_02740 [bacterium I07]